MNTLSAIQSQYNAIAGLNTAARRGVAEIAAGLNASAAAENAAGGSVKISISAAARAAAENEAAGRPGIPLPAAVRSWFDKDFTPDVLDEAKARLQAIQTQGRTGAEGPLNLPLLPENQTLLAQFRSEMQELSANGHDKMDEAQSARYNQLMNLGFRLQLVGWQQPMTEADVQREFDIGNAMAKLAHEDPSLRPPETQPVSAEQVIADADLGRVPVGWRERWAGEGLNMPTDATLTPGRPMWLTLASAAGIEDGEFMTKLRELAGENRGHALTRAVEGYISERYTALLEERAA